VGDVPSVSIRLYKQSTGAAGSSQSRAEELIPTRLVSKTANTGAHVVTAPIGLPPGTYQIKVQSGASRFVSARSGPVELDADRTAPAISNVVAAQPMWHGGSEQRVTWDSVGDVPSVSIRLYKQSTGAAGSSQSRAEELMPTHTRLVSKTANTGAHVVTAPTGLPPGTYQIEVESEASMFVSARSGPVEVDDEHRERCVKCALLLLGLPPRFRLPYPILRKISMLVATT